MLSFLTLVIELSINATGVHSEKITSAVRRTGEPALDRTSTCGRAHKTALRQLQRLFQTGKNDESRWSVRNNRRRPLKLTQRLLVYEEQWHNSYGEEKVDSPCLTAEQSSKGPTSSSRPWATCLSKTPAAGYKPKNKVLGQAFLRRPTCAA